MNLGVAGDRWRSIIMVSEEEYTVRMKNTFV